MASNEIDEATSHYCLPQLRKGQTLVKMDRGMNSAFIGIYSCSISSMLNFTVNMYIFLILLFGNDQNILQSEEEEEKTKEKP